jgi:hypothetical protein
LVAAGGQRVSLAGQLVCEGGHLVWLAGHLVTLGGQRVAMTGQAVSFTGQRVTAAGQRVGAVGHEVSATGHDVVVTGHLVSTAGQAVGSTPVTVARAWRCTCPGAVGADIFSRVALSVCSEAPSARTIGAQKISAASAGRLHRHTNLRLFMTILQLKKPTSTEHRFAGQRNRLTPAEITRQAKSRHFVNRM